MYCDNEEHRKDLIQEILINLWDSYPSFREDSKFTTWMYRVALNVAIQDLRKTKKKRLLFPKIDHLPDISEQHQSGVMEEKLKLMHDAISNLNKVEKAIVMLHLDEKPNEEIARIMGITQNYVRVKMNRIKVKLSKVMNKK